MVIFIIGFFVISIVGTILHFTYDLSNHNKIVGLFSAVNESTWEHIKMALTGFFLWSLIDGLFYGYISNYFFAKFVGCLLLIITIPIIFYSYKVFLKKAILVIDILSFYIAIFLSQYISYKLLFGSNIQYFIVYISFIGLIIVFGFYLLATILPIKSFVFKDPITEKHGFNGHDGRSKKC